MEDALALLVPRALEGETKEVLILVVMEDALAPLLFLQDKCEITS